MSDQRLSVTFGAFSCDVVGYDDPFAILTRVVELFGEIARSNPAFGAGEVRMSDMERAKLAAGLADQASRIDELADQSAPSGTRYVVSNAGADAPEIAEDASDEGIAEDEVVIAALADETALGGDLELRDTLEAVGSPEPEHEEEVVALDVAAATSEFAEDEPMTEAPLELTQPIETPVLVEAPADDDDFHIAEAVAAAPMIAVPAVEETAFAEAAATEAAHEKTDLADLGHADLRVADLKAVDSVSEDDAADETASTEAPIASQVEAKADERPKRQPLRLNLSGHGVEPEKNDAPLTQPEAKAAEPAPEKPQRRVTITKLPLRPERPQPAEQIEKVETNLKHSLSPVQKVEPVVTFSQAFGDSSDEAPKPSRADRVRAKMEQREAEDDGENFLFSDVDEAPLNAAATAPEPDEKQSQDQSPLIFAAPTPEPSTPREEPAKKPRRSIANLLGFGKSRRAEPEPAQEVPALAEDNYEGDTDGFVRLRQSVAAAMPPTDAPGNDHPSSKQPPDSISEAIDYDDETSPTAFARRVGATSLQDLLEASAVYMDVVEGKSRFSRRDVMQALNQIGSENDYTQEARLKSFRKLLTTGSLVRVDDGMFTVSQSTRFGYETRLQA